MANVTVADHIAAPADAVWEVAGGFDSLHKWLPGATATKAVGSGVGAVRSGTYDDGSVVTESLIAQNNNPPAYTYSITESALPIGNHISTLMVMEAGPADCTISWVCNFEPKGADADEIVQMFQDRFRAGFASLKELCQARR